MSPYRASRRLRSRPDTLDLPFVRGSRMTAPRSGDSKHDGQSAHPQATVSRFPFRTTGSQILQQAPVDQTRP